MRANRGARGAWVGLACLAVGCASVRPPGAGRDPLAVAPSGGTWKATLGSEPIGQAEAFRTSGFDTLADEMDTHREYAWGGLGVAVTMAAATAGLGYAYSRSPSGVEVLGMCLTGTWLLSSSIVSAVNFTAAKPPLADAQAAAASYDARLALTQAGVAVAPPRPDDKPRYRADQDTWLLAYTQAHGLEKAHLGIQGLNLPGRLEALGVKPADVVRDTDAAFADAGDPALLERAAFALQHGDSRARAATQAALARYAPQAHDEGTWLALGDLSRARSDPAQALAAYRQANQVSPRSVHALNALGRELVRQGKRKDAIALWVGAIPQLERDADRFALLDDIDAADRAWIYANAAQLPTGLPQAYADFVSERQRQQRVSNCLSECERMEWAELRQACSAQCETAR